MDTQKLRIQILKPGQKRALPEKFCPGYKIVIRKNCVSKLYNPGKNFAKCDKIFSVMEFRIARIANLNSTTGTWFSQSPKG